MKYTLLTIICICFSLSMSGQAVSADITAMSYNIRLDHAGDNENNWHQRKADMVTYLEETDADFIGVQEAIGHQLRYLDQGLGGYAYTGVGRDDGLDGGEYSAILYDSTTWKLVETNTFWLSATPTRVSLGWDAACHRVVTYGVFQNAAAQKIAILNTHFDHVGQVARRESIRLINKFVVDLTTMPVILMGDFNFTPEDDNYKALTSGLLQDAFRAAKDGGQVGTFNGFGPDEKATRRIDYVLTNDYLQLQSYQVATPKTSQDLQLSDHYPVIIKVKID